MKNKKGGFRGYVIPHKEWFAPKMEKGNIEVLFGIYYRGKRETSGELKMEWVKLDDDTYTPILSSCDDSWIQLADFFDVIQELAKMDSQSIDHFDFINILDRCGFKDVTEYERPKHLSVAESEEEMVSVTMSKKLAKKLKLIK